jgi:ABC-type cobalt transport system substrate-binding protein
MKTLTAGLFFVILFLLCSLTVAIADQEKWPGVDEAVVQKIAKEHGREKREPFINTDQGDLLLFVFLIAGAIGGFAGGYYWRIIMVERAPKVNKEKT